jgi:TolB-like protein
LDYEAASSIKSKEEIFLKTKCYTTYRIFLIALIFYVFTFSTPLSAFAKPLQVAIVPFKVNAEKDLSFLKDGIVDMLSSRLFWEGKINIINRQATEKASAKVGEPLNETKARELGTGLGADYVLFGSLTVFGNSVSIDAKMVDVSGKKQTLTFFNQSQGMDQVIPGINLFASDINEKVFARAMPSQKAPVTSQAPQAQTDVRAHPEKLFSGGFGGPETSVGQNTLNPAFITTSGVPKGTREFWKSHNFEFLINGLAIGDVDGDGKIETVIARPQSVNIYRMENNRFYKVVELPENSTQTIIGVDVADINGNGIPEIFVTSLNALENGVSSFVLEYNGQKYNEIVRNSHYYYRVVDHPERGSILFGQRQLSGSDPFSSAIFEMTWDGSDYQPGNKILPPGRANLMGFAYGNVFNDGQDLALVYDSNDHIRIFNASGQEEWKGDQPYGGSMLHLVMPLSSPGDPGDLFYLPMRIYVRDIDANGKNEVIAVNNSDVAGRHLARFRQFSHFQIEALSWNGLGLVTAWKTQETTGSIRDFAIGDFDNDGKDELVAAVILKEGKLVGSEKKSVVIAYDLNR